MGSSKTFDEFSFVENLLKGGDGKKSPISAPVLEGSDNSKVEVPAEFYELVTGSKPKQARSAKAILEEATQIEEVLEEEEEEEILEESVLLTESTGQEIVSLLEEVRNLLSEMCGTGSIGVNMGGPAPDPMKDEEKKKLSKKEKLYNRIKKRGKK